MDPVENKEIPDEKAEQKAPEGQEAKSDETLGEPGKKALESERNARKKAERENRDLKAKLQAIEDEGKSELEKAAEARQRAEAEASAANEELTRERIARKYKLNDKDTALLSGDAEAMTALASRLAGTYKEIMPDEGNSSPIPDEAAALKAAEEAGDTGAAMALKVDKLDKMSIRPVKS